MRSLNLLVTAILFLFYVLAFIVDRAAGTIYGFLVLLALITIMVGARVSDQSFGQFAKQHWLLNLAMATPFFAAVINLVASGHFDGKSIDFPSRLALFALIFWGMQFVRLKHLKYAQWAFVIGAILSAIKMYVLTEGGKSRYGTDFIPIIIFAEMTLLLGFFSFCSIAWSENVRGLVVLPKLLAVGAALYAAYISGSRGPWLSILLLLMIAGIAARGVRLKYKMTIAVIFILAAITVSQFSNIAHDRISAAKTDIQQFLDGTNVDTSLGVRFQIWHGSWVLFKENPAFGVGSRGYGQALEELARRKIISPCTATFPHSHNDVLFMMAKFGIFGLIAIFAIYLVPLYLFVRDLRNEDKEIRSVSSMGVALCGGIMILGLTDVAFLWWEIPPFYAISIAFFLSYIEKRKRHLSESPDQRNCDVPDDPEHTIIKSPSIAKHAA